MTATAVSQRSSHDGQAATVVAAAAGDRSAFAELYRAYEQKIFNLVLRSVREPEAARDLCQEIWVKAYLELPGLRQPGAFATWLYRIASRACVDRARRQSSMPVAAELTERIAARDSSPEETVIRGESARLLWEALAVLPARQHVCLFLREVEGRNYREIAEIMDTTESAVETLLFRARRGIVEAYERLQGAMQERCGHAARTMAVVIDGEATPVQQRAVEAHVDHCLPCRGQLARMQRASAAYAVLPLFPVPAMLGQGVLDAIGSLAAGGVAASGGTAGGGLAKLLALASTNTKLAAMAFTITAGLTAATLVTPADSVTTPGVSSNASLAPAAGEAVAAGASGSARESGDGLSFGAAADPDTRREDGVGVSVVVEADPAGLLPAMPNVAAGSDLTPGDARIAFEDAAADVQQLGPNILEQLTIILPIAAADSDVQPPPPVAVPTADAPSPIAVPTADAPPPPDFGAPEDPALP